MNKKVKINGSLYSKIRVMTLLIDKELSDLELKVLTGVVQLSENNTVFMSIPTGTKIKQDYRVSESGLSTGLHRLQKKGLIVRDGKTISLLPMFNNIQDLSNLIVNFTEGV